VSYHINTGYTAYLCITKHSTLNICVSHHITSVCHTTYHSAKLCVTVTFHITLHIYVSHNVDTAHICITYNTNSEQIYITSILHICFTLPTTLLFFYTCVTYYINTAHTYASHYILKSVLANFTVQQLVEGDTGARDSVRLQRKCTIYEMNPSTMVKIKKDLRVKNYLKDGLWSNSLETNGDDI